MREYILSSLFLRKVVNKMAKKTKKLEFSKIIILWSMAISTICILGYSIGYFVKGTTPDTLITLIGTILTGTVIAYMGKALVENVNKINKTNESNDEEKTTKKKKKTEIAGIIDTSIAE